MPTQRVLFIWKNILCKGDFLLYNRNKISLLFNKENENQQRKKYFCFWRQHSAGFLGQPGGMSDKAQAVF
jgi:hypothetical protein